MQGGEDWGLPEVVQQYHSLCPLEDLTSAREKSSQAFGMKTALLKGVSNVDGQAYTLRRIDNRRVIPQTSCSHQSYLKLSVHANQSQHPA